MRVCIDGRLPRKIGGTGVTTYGAVLAETVAGLGHEIEWLLEGKIGSRTGAWRGALRLGTWPVPLQGGRRVAGDVFRASQVRFDLRRSLLPLRACSTTPALMHWTFPLPLRFLDVPNVYTVHDLIPVLHPHLSPMPQRRTERLLRRVTEAATHIVTVSEASRRDIIGALGVAPDRVTNLYQAVVDVRPDDAALVTTLSNFGLEPDGYVLHAGSVERRKNVQRLIRAHRDSRTALKLVIAGPDGWNAAAEMEGAGPDVVRLPWVLRASLVSLIAGARVVVAASFAEGFGLMVAEAMALGTAVICSAGGALEEVAGGAALLIDPTDTAELAAAIAAMADNDTVEALVSAGRQRAGLFTRAAYASRLQALYADIARAQS